MKRGSDFLASLAEWERSHPPESRRRRSTRATTTSWCRRTRAGCRGRATWRSRARAHRHHRLEAAPRGAARGAARGAPRSGQHFLGVARDVGRSITWAMRPFSSITKVTRSANPAAT
jgi:hypothetical protein